MFSQIIIFALILVTDGANQEGLKCNLRRKRHLECVLSSKYDTFNVSSQVENKLLEEVEEINLIVGTPEQCYEFPVNSSGIAYPEWGLMKKLTRILIQFNLNTGAEELSLDLEEFHYMSVDSFKGVFNLQSFEVSSNSAEVRFEVDMVSGSNQLERLCVEGASIDAQEAWGNLVKIKDLKLSGVQIGSFDLGWLPLKGLTSLDLSLKELKGMNETIAAKMSQVSYLSLTVSQTQQQDWGFINKVARHLRTLKLDGFALGDIQMGTIHNSSKIQQLTLSGSSDTRSIGKYSFNSANYKTIELRGMEKLSYVGEYAFSGATDLETLTITEMPVLTELTQSLGRDVTPRTVQFNNNSKLAHISIRIFQGIAYYEENRPRYVDVRGTQLDFTCLCRASYLAAMSEIRNVEVKSNCLKNWVDKKKCTQDSCWTFDKRCNGTCSRSYNPYEYRCKCQSGDLILLPDGRTCASLESCTLMYFDEYNCTKYNAICYKDRTHYTCHCEGSDIWSDTKYQCVKDSIIPLVSAISTKYTLVPLVTNSTAKSMIPLVTNSTAKTMIPLVTNSTAKTMIPLITNSTTISANTIGPTVLTFKTLHPPTPYSPTKSLQPPTKLLTDVTLVPEFTNSTKHTVTANSIAPAVVKTTPTMSLQPANNTTPGSRVGLQLWQEIVVGISSSIALLVIIALLLLVAVCFYRRKKGISQFELRDYSPRLLDSEDDQ